MRGLPDGFRGIRPLHASETFHVGLEHGAAHRQIGNSALALHFDKTSLAQLLHMMRDGGRTDALMLVQRAAGHAAGRGNLLKNGEAARIGKRARDGVKLLVR